MTGGSSLDQESSFARGLRAAHFGRQPISGTSIADLDHRRLVDYFVRVREQDLFETPKAYGQPDAAKNRTMRVSQPERNHSYEVAWQSLLLNTGILQRRFGAQNGESPAATVASLILFGKDPSRHLPQAGIEATAYIGKTKDGNVRERGALHGPIVPQHGEDGAVQEPGLVGQTMAFIRRFASTERFGSDARQGAWDYAPEAVCEAIFNAITHRDYLSASAIEVDVYADRLEVVSPGPLPDHMTVDKMRAGTRCIRNEFLGNVVRDYRRPKKPRLGVHRLIIDGMKSHNGTEPDLIAEDARFTVRLWKSDVLPDCTPNAEFAVAAP